MERKYGSNEDAIAVAHEAMWLAYQASFPMGLGHLRERGGESREQVIEATFLRPGAGYADYVAGRMMKTSFTAKDSTLKFSDNQPRGDYQSWAGKYGTYAALVDAAESALKISQSTTA